MPGECKRVNGMDISTDCYMSRSAKQAGICNAVRLFIAAEIALCL